jgi:branched-chain amino acid transport system substrate-binding protein
MRHSIVGFVGWACAAAAWCAFDGPAARGEEPITLGVVLPFSGQNGDYDKRYLLAPTELAAKEANEKGVLGRQVKVIAEDSRYDAATAVAALQKLADVDKVLAVFTGYTFLTLPQLPVAEEKHIIVMAPSTEHPDLTKSRWAVRMTPTADKAGVVIAQLATKLDLKTMAIVAEDNEAVRITVRAFEAEYGKHGGKVLGDETFKTQDTDMRAQLTKLRAAQADALYIMVSAGRPMALVLKQLAEVGLRPKQIFANHLIEDKEVQAIGGEMAEGVIYTSLKLTPDFVAHFKSAMGYDPDANAGKHYDATQFLFAGIRKANSANPEKVRDALYNYGEFKGALGTFRFEGSGEPGIFPILKTVKGGAYVDYQP